MTRIKILSLKYGTYDEKIHYGIENKDFYKIPFFIL